MINRGDIWFANLDPTVGHEQGGGRPVLVVSNDIYNNGPATLVTVIPITRTDRGIPIHVVADPADSGLPARSVIQCDAVRTISKQRLGRQAGSLSPAKMAEVEDKLRIHLSL